MMGFWPETVPEGALFSKDPDQVDETRLVTP